MEELQLELNQGDSKHQNFSTYFIPQKILGQGSFGKVLQVIDISTHESIALKMINKRRMTEQSIEKIKQEADILQSLNHPNIVKFKKLVETNCRIFIGMEIAKGGSLQELIKKRNQGSQRFTQNEASQILKSIMEGLVYIHSQNIIHRDIKPENILIDNINDFSTIKIADFGLSQGYSFWSTTALTQQCGTLLYMAPEFFTGSAYSKQVDLWSCGIILYKLLDCGNHPFYDNKKDNAENYKNKLIQRPEVKYPGHLNKLSINILEKLLAFNPSERYSASQVLQHPFITKRYNDDIPMTFNEKIMRVQKLEGFMQKIKGLLVLQFLVKESLRNKVYRNLKYVNSNKQLIQQNDEQIFGLRQFNLNQLKIQEEIEENYFKHAQQIIYARNKIPLRCNQLIYRRQSQNICKENSNKEVLSNITKLQLQDQYIQNLNSITIENINKEKQAVEKGLMKRYLMNTKSRQYNINSKNYYK